MRRLVPLIALAIAFAIALEYVEPTYSGPIADTQKLIDGDNQALQAAQTYLAKENELAKERDSIDPADMARLQTFLPSSVDNILMILDLNALAARSGMVLNAINVNPPDANSSDTPQPAVGSVNLFLSASGPYSAFRTFLEGIEKSARVLDVTNLTVKGSDTGVYSYDITLKLYWLR